MSARADRLQPGRVGRGEVATHSDERVVRPAWCRGFFLSQAAATSRKEAGNRRYDILQRIDRENQFVILEAWSDLKAAEAHAGGSALISSKKSPAGDKC